MGGCEDGGDSEAGWVGVGWVCMGVVESIAERYGINCIEVAALTPQSSYYHPQI